MHKITLDLTDKEYEAIKNIITTKENTKHTLGDVINILGYDWNIVHINHDDALLVLALHTIPYFIPFGQNNKYGISYLKKVRNEFADNLRIRDTNGIVKSCFIPTIEEIKSYEWFKEKKNRKCKDATGDYCSWWTSSSSNASGVCFVSGSGDAYGTYYGYTVGFRPFIIIKSSN